LRLYDAAYREGAPGRPPGSVLADANGAIDVAAVGGVLRIGRLQREGAAKQAAAAVAPPGSVLGPGVPV